MRGSLLLLVLLIFASCSKQPEEKLLTEDSDPSLNMASMSEAVLPALPATEDTSWMFGTLQLNISRQPAFPEYRRFQDDYWVEVHNIDDHGRRLGPSWWAQSTWNGWVDMQIPIEMFDEPMLVTACNDAAYPAFSGVGTEGTLVKVQAFIPPHCPHIRINVDPITNFFWTTFQRQAFRLGAQSYAPSNFDCEIYAKGGTLFYLLPRVQEILYELPEIASPTLPLVQVLKENMELFYKSRPPLCFAERRHNGGGLNEGRVIEPRKLEDEDEERFIHTFKKEGHAHDHLSFFSDEELEERRDEDTVTVGKNGLLRQLCANGKKHNLFKSSLIVNGEKIGNPNIIYDLDSEDFVGNIATFEDPKDLEDLTIKEYTVRHTNGYPREHDDFEQVCSVTAMTLFTNDGDEQQELNVGSGLLLDNLFDDNGANAVVFDTSDGDQVIDNQDTWAIIFDAVTNEALVIELLGFRNGDYRDALAMNFDRVTKELFIGLREDYVLNEDGIDGEEANFTTTITYLNAKNVNRTLSACDQAADFLARQHIDELSINEEGLAVPAAAEMVANSRCFSNSFSNQRWQSYRTGLWSINNSKGTITNLYLPFAWNPPFSRLEFYLKKWNESVYRGPITTVLGGFTDVSLEIPGLTEGDEILFFSEDSCCNDFKVVVPCTAEPASLPLPGIPTKLDVTGIDTVPMPVIERAVPPFQPLPRS